MTGIVRSPGHDTRRGWTVYIIGALEPSQCISIVILKPSNNGVIRDSVVENR